MRIIAEIFRKLKNSRCKVKNEPKMQFVSLVFDRKISLEQAFASYLA
jgi:hypothetical protein